MEKGLRGGEELEQLGLPMLASDAVGEKRRVEMLGPLISGDVRHSGNDAFYAPLDAGRDDGVSGRHANNDES